MGQPAQKSPGRQNDRSALEPPPIFCHHGPSGFGIGDQFCRFALDDRQVREISQRLLHGETILLAIGLGARTTNRRPLGAIEKPELDPRTIRDPAHETVESIDFPDEMPLAQPADSGIAGHRPDSRKAEGQQRGSRPHPRRRRRRLAAGMAAADDDDIEMLRFHRRLSHCHGARAETPCAPVSGIGMFHVKPSWFIFLYKISRRFRPEPVLHRSAR